MVLMVLYSCSMLLGSVRSMRFVCVLWVSLSCTCILRMVGVVSRQFMWYVLVRFGVMMEILCSPKLGAWVSLVR